MSSALQKGVALAPQLKAAAVIKTGSRVSPFLYSCHVLGPVLGPGDGGVDKARSPLSRTWVLLGALLTEKCGESPDSGPALP